MVSFCPSIYLVLTLKSITYFKKVIIKCFNSRSDALPFVRFLSTKINSSTVNTPLLILHLFFMTDMIVVSLTVVFSQIAHYAKNEVFYEGFLQ